MNDANQPPQPEVLEATWDRARIATLFDELRQHAEIHRIQVRTLPASGSPHDTTATLDEAGRLLQEDRAVAVQIYYRFDDQCWCDSLFPDGDSIRVVRTALPADRFPL